MTVPCVANDADHQSLEWLSGHPVKVLLDSAATGGQLMMLESTPHAGSASPLHVHGWEDEMFLLLAGAVVVVVGEQRYELGKGGVAFLPRECCTPTDYQRRAPADADDAARARGVLPDGRADLATPKPDGRRRFAVGSVRLVAGRR